MSTVVEIENAISSLPRNELAELREWFGRFDADAWDRQMEQDAASGKLDALYQCLQKENEGQADISLHEVVNEEELP